MRAEAELDRQGAPGGLLLVDKPGGITSHDVVRRVRRGLGRRDVGHTGTLDPMATGLLVLLVGAATKLARFLQAEDKTYDAIVRLGRATDSFDADGATTAEGPYGHVRAADVRATVGALAGVHQQAAPAFSAVRVGGERLYRRARRGDLRDGPVRTVVVHRATLVAFEPPDVRVTLEVSKGVYVRAVAHDLGSRLGAPAHLAALRRTRVGPFRLEDAVPLDGVTPTTSLRDPLEGLGHLQRVEVTDAARRAVEHGVPIGKGAVDLRAPVGVQVAVVDRCGALLAIGRIRAGEDGVVLAYDRVLIHA